MIFWTLSQTCSFFTPLAPLSLSWCLHSNPCHYNDPALLIFSSHSSGIFYEETVVKKIPPLNLYINRKPLLVRLPLCFLSLWPLQHPHLQLLQRQPGQGEWQGTSTEPTKHRQEHPFTFRKTKTAYETSDLDCHKDDLKTESCKLITIIV